MTAVMGFSGICLLAAAVLAFVVIVVRTATQFEPCTLDVVGLWRFIARATVASLVVGGVLLVAALRRERQHG